MGKLVLNVGTANNDKTGDTLRAGGLKIKANFQEIYTALANDGVNISGGNLLKTGDYADLRNKPDFSAVAVSGNFFDLEARPDIGIFVGAPGNSEGSDGHVAGNLAFDGNNLYVCREDYVEQDQFTNFIFQHEEDYVDFHLLARFDNTDGTIALTKDITKPTPSVDWTVSDGVNRRTITLVSEEMDGSTPYYLCYLDGAFTSNAGTSYEVAFTVPAGQHVFCATWKPEYQALLDAHDLGQGSKLYVTYDGYGRVITQIIHDSIDNEITIAYIAGSTIADYEGIIVKLDQPKIWKSIPWAPVYADPFPGGGSGSTGDVTFAGTTITGTGNTLTLKADSTANYGLELFNSIDNDTHLRPLMRDKGVALGFGYGMGSHIRVEGTNGQGGVPNSGDRVGIFAMDTDTGNSAEWIFDNDGILTLPTGGDIKDSDGNSVLGGGGGGGYQATVTEVNGDWHSGSPNNYNVSDYNSDVLVVNQNSAVSDITMNMPESPVHGKMYTIKYTGVTDTTKYCNIVATQNIDNIPQAISIRKDGGYATFIWDDNWATWWTIASDLVPTLPQGQYDLVMNGTSTTLTAVDFALLMSSPDIGYSGSDPHTVILPAGNPGQRLVIVNNASLCTLIVDPNTGMGTFGVAGTAEFVYTTGMFGNGWVPLYGNL